jgi:FKBP-type peptidyl-prolyl cis-trans isomerase FkpA
MKKISVLFVAVLALMMGLTSCDNQKSAKLKTQLDSINYAFGVMNGPSVKMGYLNGDSTSKAVEAFLKGFEEGSSSNDKYITQYMSGLNIGASLKKQAKAGFLNDSTMPMNLKLIKAGLLAGIKGKGKMRPEQAEIYFRSFMEKKQSELQKKESEKKAKLFSKNIETGKKFLEENKKNPNVKTTASGLQYEIIKAGTGPTPKATDAIKVNYKGTLIDGTVFDSSKEPATMTVGQGIKGWVEALQMMPVGSKWNIYIPAELAYQDQERGPIKPYSTLIFEVELLSIEKTPAAPAGAPAPVR